MSWKQWGMDPEKKLLERSIRFILTNWHKFVGIVPHNRFPLSKRIFKLESLPIALGMLLDNLLWLTSNDKRPDTSRKAFGIDPEKKFSSKCMWLRDPLRDHEGKDPKKRLLERSRKTNEIVSQETLPLKKLSRKSSRVSFVWLYIQLGILPTMLLLLTSKKLREPEHLDNIFDKVPENLLSFILKTSKLVKLKLLENKCPWKLTIR